MRWSSAGTSAPASFRRSTNNDRHFGRRIPPVFETATALESAAALEEALNADLALLQPEGTSLGRGDLALHGPAEVSRLDGE